MSRASIGDYVVTSKLGSGSFAVVYKGYHKVTKVPVAIKAMSLHKLNSKLLANLEMEIAIMRQIDHPNIVKLYEIKKTEKHMYLMLEYCAGGDLQQYMRRQQKAAPGLSASQEKRMDMLPEPVAQHFLRELAKGMKCLWQHNLIHRDLKPQNLLLVEDSATSVLKIADFGFARHLATTSLAETLCGSPLYMAPEILKFQKYDAKADLWSVGTILYEMVVGKPPYGGSNHVQLLANIERHDLRFPPQIVISSPCKQLLMGLLHRRPVTRMGFDEFFHHEYVGLADDPSPSPAFAGSSSASTDGSLMLMTSQHHHAAAASIREEDEEDEEEEEEEEEEETQRAVSSVLSQATVGADGGAMSPLMLANEASTPPFKPRAASESHTSLMAAANSPGPLRQSRSGNLEVMQTVFGSTSTAGSTNALRRSSSRLGRSRRSISSGAILISQKNAHNSPKLSPQMSPQVLPSPSPRINPFKQLTESPPLSNSRGQYGSPSPLSLRTSMQRSHHQWTAPAALRVASGAHTASRLTKMASNALDSSGEYVLVESGVPEKVAASHSTYRSASFPSAAPSTISSSSLQSGNVQQQQPSMSSPFSPEYGQQLVEIIMLRTQAIASIAEQFWTLSNGSYSPISTCSSNANLESTSSLGSAMSCSGGGIALVAGLASSSSSVNIDDAMCDDVIRPGVLKKQYIYAAEALALYVKCLRLVQHGVLYLRQDPALSKRLPGGASTHSPSSSSSSGSSGTRGSPMPWSEASRKLSMAYLMEQLNYFLDRAEQSKKRMATCISTLATSNAPTNLAELAQAVSSQEELLYAHALRLGKEGAVQEVLGQTRPAYDLYLQAMLLLESLLMETAVPVTPGAASLAVEDQKSVHMFVRALDERLKNVKASLDGALSSKFPSPLRVLTFESSPAMTAVSPP